MNFIERNLGSITNKDHIFVSSYATLNQNESTDFLEFQPAEDTTQNLAHYTIQL